MKPLKPGKSTKPTRSVERIESRRTIVWQYMLQGGDALSISRALAGTEHAMSRDTIEDDIKALRAEATTLFEAERKDMAAMAIAKLNRIQQQLERTATLAETGGGEREVDDIKDGKKVKRTIFRIKPSLHAKATALAAARQVVMDAAKIAGVVVEKQEHSGAVMNMNLNAEATPAEMQAFVGALNQAGFDGDAVAAAMKDAA
jgi:hypothetical protein